MASVLQDNTNTNTNNNTLYFKTYDDFLEGLEFSLCTEYYMDTYPEYYKESQCSNENIDLVYIKHFLTYGLDPQDGLIKMLNTLYNGNRYAKDVIFEYVNEFIKHGAKIYDLTESIFYVQIDLNEIHTKDDFEDYLDTNSITTRALVMKHFYEYLNKKYINSVVNWSELTGKKWEENNSTNYKKVLLEYYKYLIFTV